MKKHYSFTKAIFALMLILSGSFNSFAQTNSNGNDFEYQTSKAINGIYNNLRHRAHMSRADLYDFIQVYSDSLAGTIKTLNHYYIINTAESDPTLQNYITSTEDKLVKMYANIGQAKKAAALKNKNSQQASSVCNTNANLDFGSGTLASWTCGYADCSIENNGSCIETSSSANGGPAAFSYTTPTLTSPTTASKSAGPDANTGNDYQIQIETGSRLDAVSGLPVVCPGYNYSVMIGDSSATPKVAGGLSGPNSGVGILQQTFEVTTANATLNLNYAIVLENPIHCFHQQPYFRFALLDQNNDTISGQILVAGAQTSGPGWKTIASDIQGYPCAYLPWTSNIIPLKKYIGQCVTMVAIASDCGQGGHFGYAYLVASASADSITVSSSSFCSNPITLTAPAGGITYQWSGPCISGANNTQSISAACAGKYGVIIGSALGAKYDDTLTTVISNGSAGVKPIFKADTVCVGTSTDFTNLTSGAGLSYKWNFGDAGSGTADTTSVTNPTHIYSAGGTYLVSLTATNGTCGHDTSIYILVNSNPVITITSSPKNDTVCTGGNITLSGSGAVSYIWSGGITDAMAFSPSASGQYVVIGKAANGCSTKDSVTVVTSNNALPIITVLSNPTNDSVCNGSSIILTASGATTYSWTNGITNGVAFAPSATNQYIVTGTNTVGCSNRDTVKVTVITPNITITSVPTNDIVCKGSSITLSGNGGVSYIWSGGITDGTPFSPTTAGNYAVTGTDKYGCKNTDTAKIQIDVPSVSIASLPKNDTVCAGSVITLTGTGSQSYSWSGGITNGVAFATPITEQYVIMATDSNGCKSKDSVTVTAGSGALPTVSVLSLPTNDSICKGNNISLTASGGAYYNWTGGVTNGIAFSPTSSGKYIVTATNNTGCSNNDTVSVTVVALPTINITGQNLVIAGTTDTLIASGGTSYKWNDGTTKDTLIVTPTTATTYTVYATNAFGCTDSATFTVSMRITTGVKTISNITTVTIYPNPATDILNVEFNGKATDALVRISDITGKQISAFKTSFNGKTTTSINISSLAAGMYFMQVETSTGSHVLKFIKK